MVWSKINNREKMLYDVFNCISNNSSFRINRNNFGKYRILYNDGISLPIFCFNYFFDF